VTVGLRSALTGPPGSFRELVRLEWRLALREPSGLAIGIGIPIVLFLIFAAIPSFRHGTVAGTNLNVFELYIPILLATSFVFIALVGLAPPLVRDREIGWLRRLSTTPVSPAQLLAAQVVIYLVVALIVSTLFIVLAAVLTGVYEIPQFGGFLLALVLGVFALYSVGLLLSALATDQKSMQRLTAASMYPLLFFAGLYVPLQILPAPFETISNYTPVGAAVEAMTQAISGSFPSGIALSVTAAYGVVFGLLAVRLFRWE
jgi:ABC-2 type transport system permease protein